VIRRIIEVIRSGAKFLITSHVRLDGDAVGSELALHGMFREMGKDAVIYNQDEVPWNYRFLPGCDEIVHKMPPVEDYDAVFVLDCSELERIGDEAEKLTAAKLLVNIDHHLSNEGFAELRIVDHRASSTGELLCRLIGETGVRTTKDMATNLYAAILTDTGGFRYATTGKETLLVAGALVGSGADPQWISENIYEDNPLERIRLLALVLGTLNLDLDGTVGSLVVNREALACSGALAGHTDGFVDYPRTIQGVVISVLYMEVAEGLYKVSLRSKGRWNVERVARNFGGGGHMNAAACRINGDLATVRKLVLDVIEVEMGRK